MISLAPAHIISQLEREMDTLPGPDNEITQHLIELGYIPLQKVNALRLQDIARAKEKFLDEVVHSGLFPERYTDKLLTAGTKFMLITLLRRLADIDEGIALKVLPSAGDCNLTTRLIHYRLDLFGLWPMDVSASYSGLSVFNIGQIAGFAKCAPLEAVNLMGDVEKLTRHLLQVYPPEEFILTFKSPMVSEKTKKTLDRRYAFRRQLISDFEERNDFFKYLCSEILKNNPDKVDFGFLQRESLDPFKKFILRLIQVHQWQDGFYSGLLDGDIGEVTIGSFLEAIGFYNSSDNKNIKTHRAITYVHRGYFLFNSLFFLKEYMIGDEASGDTTDEQLVIDNLTSQIAKADEKGRADFTESINKLKKDVYSDAEKQPHERKGFLQRIYFGAKRLIKKAFRFAKKIFLWIKDKVLKAWGFLKKLFRNLFENLHMGISAFIDGINFLFGRKAIESENQGEVIASKFSIDGDSVSISSSRVELVLDHHLSNIGTQIKSMKFTLAIVGGVLKLIAGMINIITWPLLIMNIIKIYKNISASFQELETA